MYDGRVGPARRGVPETAILTARAGEPALNTSVHTLLRIAEGPLLRVAFAVLILGALRSLLLFGSDLVAARLTITDKAVFWRKLRWRFLWLFYPPLVRPYPRYRGHPGLFTYHMFLSTASLVFRLGLIVVPAFMVAHVYLWERGLGGSWPAMPIRLSDILVAITVAAGVVLFMGRMYSSLLRYYEPGWTFFKPLLLLAPLVTGYLAMHPTSSVIDYHVTRLVHVLSAELIFVLAPFARMFTCVHVPLTQVVPDAAWDAESASLPAALSRQGATS